MVIGHDAEMARQCVAMMIMVVIRTKIIIKIMTIVATKERVEGEAARGCAPLLPARVCGSVSEFRQRRLMLPEGCLKLFISTYRTHDSKRQ